MSDRAWRVFSACVIATTGALFDWAYGPIPPWVCALWAVSGVAAFGLLRLWLEPPR